MTLSHIAGCRGIRDIAGLMQQLGAGEEDKPQKKDQKKDEIALASRSRNVDGLTRALPAWLAPIKKN